MLNNQRGATQFLVLLILIAGLAAAFYLSQKTTIFKPKASVSGPIGHETSMNLVADKSTYKVGEEIKVQIVVHSDIDTANLFDAKIAYDDQILALGRVDVTSDFVKNWVEQYWGDPGEVSLIGGTPNPGFQSQPPDVPVMATLYFTSLKEGNTTVKLREDSAIYRNSDNINILTITRPVSVTINQTGTVTVTQAPGPTIIAVTIAPVTPRPTTIVPTPTPVFGGGSGDGNDDGRITLADMSVLLSSFPPAPVNKEVDINGDGVINSVDFSLMRNLLIEKNVIRP